MKNNIHQIIIMYEWIKQVFWLIGWALICIIKLDRVAVVETLIWLNIHLTCEFNIRLDLKRKLPLKRQINNFLIRLLGYLFLLSLVVIINLWLMHLIKYIKILLN